MPLAMQRPWKLPKSKYFGSENDCLKICASWSTSARERSLQTRSRRAKRRHAEGLAEIEARWANLRAGPKGLTGRVVHLVAIPIHDRWLQQHMESPSRQTGWNLIG